MLAIRPGVFVAAAFVAIGALVGGVVTPAYAGDARAGLAAVVRSEDVTDVSQEASGTPSTEAPTTPTGDFSPSTPHDTETPAATTSPEPPAPAGSTPGSGEAFDASTAQVVGRGEYDQTYLTPDGSKMTQLSLEPLNVQVDGAWKPIQTDVTGVGFWSWLGFGGAEVPQHPLEPEFAATASDPNVLSLTNDNHTIGFTLLGAADSQLNRDLALWSTTKDHLEYPDVFPNTDLVYDVETGGVKELLRLKQAPAADEDPSWSWDVNADGLTLAKDADGNVQFTDQSGTSVFVIPRPQVWDSAGNSDKQANASSSVALTLRQDGSKWVVTLGVSRTWLDDPARVYPVMVDPTTTVPHNDTHAYKTNGQQNINYGVQVGNTNVNGTWRTLAHYNYEQFFGKQILNVQIGVGVDSSDSTTTTRVGGVYHATAFNYDGVGEKLASLSVDASGGLAYDDRLTTRYAQWVRDRESGAYLIFTGDESNTFTYKHLDTLMSVWWKDFPTPGSLTTPSPTNGGSSSISPTLKTAGYTDPGGAGISFKFSVSENSNVDVGTVWNSGWISADMATVPQTILQGNKKYYWKVDVKDAYDGVFGTDTEVSSATWSFTTIPPPIPNEATASPTDGEIVTTLTPTFKVDPVTGSSPQYWFRVATGTDAKSGAIVNSGWQSSPTWAVPVGTLQDGGRYSWGVKIKAGTTEFEPFWVHQMTVNQRIGNSGPAPTDAAGPVAVNLANGNVSMQFASPTVSTVGGPMGFSFSYNSQQSSDRGLTGSYYDVTPAAGQTPKYVFTSTMKPVLVRTDPQISFEWGTVAPAPALPLDNYLVRWTGFITPPSAGNYTFGFVRDDGARLFLNDNPTPVIDQWTQSVTTTPSYATSASSLSGPTPITVEYSEQINGAYVQLWVKDSSGNEFIVPPDWFTTKLDSLPNGWSSSSALSGAGSDYAKASVTESAVILTDTTGTAHTFTKTSTGGYKPPTGEYGVLALDTKGQVSLTDESGATTLFNPAGKVTQVTSAAEITNPAAPVTAYRPATGQVDRISDPLSAVTPATNPATFTREVRFAYAGDTAASVGLSAADTDGTGAACPIPAGYLAPPTGMLCRLIYPGHKAGADDTTQLLYNVNKQLAGILDPGQELTTFGYTTTSAKRLAWLRDSTANDWLAADTTRTAASTNRTSISYDSGRVNTVTLPAPDGVTQAARPVKTYTYATGTTYVDVAGLTVPTTAPSNGHARTVTFDDAYRKLTDMSASGLKGTLAWGDQDMLFSQTDALSRKTTNIYNDQDRLTDTYGPAPETCFDTTTRIPKSGCAVTPAHSSTTYDSGLNGLNATWFDNPSLGGTPKSYSLGVGPADGSVNKDWAANAPVTGFPVDKWSLRLTGLIKFNQAGTYKFQTYADDGSQIWLDDVLTSDDWVSSAAHWSPNGNVIVKTAGQTMRIRVQYWDDSSTASLALYWTTPGGTHEIIPGRALTPDYGLTTGGTVDDSAPTGVSGVSSAQVPSMTSTTDYGASPWLGQASTTTVDPAGLNLRTNTVFETAGTGYLRRTSKTLPTATSTGTSAATAGTTFSYYGDQQTIGQAWTVTTPICGVPASTPQFGFLKKSTGPTPAVGSAIVTQYVYDLMGRAVGSKRSGDPGWTCATLDLRGRTTSTSYPAYSGSPARTATFAWTGDNTAAGDPLTTWAEDPTGRVTTKTNLLGQAVSYTDVWGTVTTADYNLLGQALTTTSTPPGGIASVQTATYNLDGQVVSESIDGRPIAAVTYAQGQLVSVTYPAGTGNAGNGTSLTAITRDAAGRDTGFSWAFPGQNTVSDQVVRSQSGRILQDILSDGPAASASTYSYDTAGRLISAIIPRHQLSYGYGPSTGCGTGAVAGAGLNGNRSTLTDSLDGGTAAATAYCYDAADRLISTAVTNPQADADPIAGMNLTASALAYDAHGNTVTLADQTLAYDTVDRHRSTTLASGASVSYVRDVADRIVARTETPVGGTASTIRYGFTGSGDSPDLILDSANVLKQRTLSLPGGASVQVPAAGDQVWSYPNLHGDVTVTADQTGTRVGALFSYDPFGQPIDSATGRIGTAVADQAVPGLMTPDAYEARLAAGYAPNPSLLSIRPSARPAATRGHHAAARPRARHDASQQQTRALKSILNTISSISGWVALGSHTLGAAAFALCGAGPASCAVGAGIAEVYGALGDIAGWTSAGTYCYANGFDSRCVGGIVYGLGITASTMFAPPFVNNGVNAVADFVWQMGG